MALPTATIERYLGGGKLYFAPYAEDGVTLGAEVEIGEVMGFKAKITPETKEAMSHDAGMEKVVDEAVVSIKGDGSYETQNLDVKNRALALFGNATTEVFAIGATLPNGDTAAAETTLTVIHAASTPMVKGQLRFVGAHATGAKYPVALFPKVSLTPNGDYTYQNKEWQKQGFSFKIIETATGWFREYWMTA